MAKTPGEQGRKPKDITKKKIVGSGPDPSGRTGGAGFGGRNRVFSIRDNKVFNQPVKPGKGASKVDGALNLRKKSGKK